MEKTLLQIQFPQIEAKPLEALVPYARNPKQHGEEQLAKMVASLREFGWTFPILTDEQGEVIAGHGRLLAAQRVHKFGWSIPGWEDTGTVPVLSKQGLSDNQKRAYRILDNRIAEEAGIKSFCPLNWMNCRMPSSKETLINSANEMKREAHGTQQPRHINKIGEGASTAQRRDSLVQSINQRFPNSLSISLLALLMAIFYLDFIETQALIPRWVVCYESVV